MALRVTQCGTVSDCNLADLPVPIVKDDVFASCFSSWCRCCANWTLLIHSNHVVWMALKQNFSNSELKLFHHLFVLCLINLSLMSGNFSWELKTAVVVSVFKKGNRANPANYRPISLLSCMSRVLEHFVLEQFTWLPGKKMSIAWQLINMAFVMVVRLMMPWVFLLIVFLGKKNARHHSGAVFLDLSKAFDTVDHCRLLENFFCSGFTYRALSCIQSYRTDRFQVVRKGQCFSNKSPCLRGVPQGSKLSFFV